MIVGNIQGQIWQSVRRAWRRIARAGLIAALAGLIIGEFLGAVLNGGHQTLFVHIVSLTLALVMAYGATVTVGIFQAIRGIFGAVNDLERTVSSAMGATDRGWQVVDSDEAKARADR